MATTRKVTEEVTPEAPKGLFHKLHQAKQHIGKVAKNATNPHFKKTYADINSLLETVEPILLANGLIFCNQSKRILSSHKSLTSIQVNQLNRAWKFQSTSLIHKKRWRA